MGFGTLWWGSNGFRGDAQPEDSAGTAVDAGGLFWGANMRRQRVSGAVCQALAGNPPITLSGTRWCDADGVSTISVALKSPRRANVTVGSNQGNRGSHTHSLAART